MDPISIVYLIVFIAALFVAFAMAPKAVVPKPSSLEDMNIPTAEPGRPISVVFGKRLLKAPNVVWYGDMRYEKVEVSGGK